MKIKNIAEKFFGAKFLDDIFVRYLDRQPGFNQNNISIFYKNKYADCIEVDSPRYLEEIFKSYYTDKSVDHIIPGSKINYVAAYTPYRKNYSNILIFNFFQKNYGIRDPILIRLSLEHEKEVFFSKQFLLSPNEVKFLKFSCLEIDNFPSIGSIIIEAFHPKIKTPNNELRFFLLLNDVENDTLAAVHSMPIPKRAYKSKINFGFRAYLPVGQNASYSNIVNSDLKINSVSNKNGLFNKASSNIPFRGPSGYLLMKNQHDILTGIWHDNYSNNTKEVIQTSYDKELDSNCYTSFYVPNFNDNAPILYFSENEIGFNSNKILLKCYHENGDLITEKEFENFNDGIDLKKSFVENNIIGGVYFIVDFKQIQQTFKVNPPCYLHIYYRSKDSFSDQVHSHSSSGYKNDYFQKNKSYRCSKMAPFFRNYKNVYALSTIGGICENPDKDINIRIYTDIGTEHVINNYSLNISNGVSVIHGEEILKVVGTNINDVAIIWIEHQSTNFNGSWFVINKDSGHLATDHFTGA